MNTIKSKLFISKLKKVIGFIGSVVTILLVFWDDFPARIDGYETCGFFILLLISICAAGLLSLPRNGVEIKLSDTVNARIHYGNLLEQHGIIVIPVNEYFDTIVDDEIVSSNTLHGLFIQNTFGSDVSDLESQIEESLSNTPVLDTNTDRRKGNQKRYELGTVAQVNKYETRYFLVALTRFNTNDRAEVTKTEYQQVLCSLFDYVEQHSQGFKLNLPLIGAGHSGVSLPKQKLLEFLVFTIQLNDKLTLVKGVDIILHKSIKSEIYLNMLEHYYSLQ